ncbi:MAG: tripartite tricarboxylate transporter TctB family protein [Candidatus Limnocylindria bacterium]
MTTEDRGSRAAERSLLGPRIVAAVLLALSVLLILSALGVAQGGGYSVVGPATFPLAIAIGLFVLGAAFAVRTTIWPDDDLAASAAEEERATHWPTAGLTLASLAIYGLALDGFEVGPLDVPGLGYVIATGLFLPVTARVLGSRSPIRDLVIGFVVAIVLYIGFTEYLGVRLPPGLLGLVF